MQLTLHWNLLNSWRRVDPLGPHWRLPAERDIRRRHLLQVHRGRRRSGDGYGSSGNSRDDSADSRHDGAGGERSLVPVRLAVALAVLVTAVARSVGSCSAELEHIPVEDVVVSEALLVKQVPE